MQDARQGTGLRPVFTPLGIWAFSIGTSIGWGSFIVTCNTYLQKSGILGTILGLLVGMAVVFVITWNLQIMIRKSPNAGGVYAFERSVGGKDLGFLGFWFVLLTYLAILWANMTSLPLFARFFLGHTFQFGFHYQIFGYEVWLGEALLSTCAVALIGLLCAKSARLPNRIMIVAALTFAASFLLCAVVVLLRHESAFSFSPYYTEGSGAFSQIVRIAAISPWAFIGFENVSHFSEEYTFPLKRIRGILIWSVVVTTALYLFVSALSVSAYPPEYESWLAYIQDMGNLEGIKAVPAFYVVQHYLGGVGVAVLMLSLFVPFLGRTAIGWIVDVTTLCATLIYGLISHAVLLSSKRDGDRWGFVTGVAGLALMVCFGLLLLIPGLLPFDAMATESYFLFIVWALLGLAYFRWLQRRDKGREYGKSAVVWVVLLTLVLFASMMWVSRATEEAANQAAERIFQYHQSHSAVDMEESSTQERERFLQEQAQQVSKTNTLYSVVSLGIFLLSIVILLDSFRENNRLGEQLSVAEQEARTAKQIAELKESINSLLDNMPAMSFSKDAQTGTYLACNQAFAEFAHKQTPAEVVGLTDYQIFDGEVAAHFVEDDRRALLMDIPFVLNEDVIDAAGNPRQFQTTKLKFYDTSGRLCLLGMSLDVTEMERFKRESEQAQAAYQEALTTSTVYESIIDSLAEDYFNLFYVDLKTDEYIEYGSRTEAGHRSMESRGTDFFATSRRNAPFFIYAPDQAMFIAAMDKERLVSEISAHGVFILQYRLLIEGHPTYVNLKATFSSGDDRFMIIGVNNIDALVKERAAAQKTEEERKAFARLNALNGNMIVLYFVDPQNNHYTEYNATSGYEWLGLSKEGEDFFASTYEEARKAVHPDDLELFRARVTKENILRSVEQDGVFSVDYRLVGGELPTYVRLKVAQVVEGGKPMLIVGLSDEDAQIRHELEYERNLNAARMRATRDQLTGVRNKHAYVDQERELDELIRKSEDAAFIIVVCDINDLKKVNDVQGHKAGDRYIRDACSVICNAFKHSPVFRIGGDEFAVICRGHDYEHIDEIIVELEQANVDGRGRGGIQIASGYARHEAGQTVEEVFELADRRMYRRKSQMKAEGGAVS